MPKQKQTCKKMGSVVSLRLTSKAGVTDDFLDNYNALDDQTGTLVKAFKILCRLNEMISEGTVSPDVLQMYEEIEIETIRMKFLDNKESIQKKVKGPIKKKVPSPSPVLVPVKLEINEESKSKPILNIAPPKEKPITNVVIIKKSDTKGNAPSMDF